MLSGVLSDTAHRRAALPRAREWSAVLHGHEWHTARAEDELRCCDDAFLLIERCYDPPPHP